MNLAFETKISTATASIIVLIALYFTLSWGYEAVQVLTSPSYGFEDVSRSCICALHIADRARCFMRGQPNSEILEAGLILAVLITIASVGPASWAHSADLMREHTYQLLFAAIATGLCIFERSYAHRAETSEARPQPAVDAAATKAAPRLHV